MNLKETRFYILVDYFFLERTSGFFKSWERRVELRTRARSHERRHLGLNLTRLTKGSQIEQNKMWPKMPENAHFRFMTLSKGKEPKKKYIWSKTRKQLAPSPAQRCFLFWIWIITEWVKGSVYAYIAFFCCGCKVHKRLVIVMLTH